MAEFAPARADAPAVHPFVSRAFQALDATGHPWALLRGADDLSVPTGDVDVLVASAALDALEQLDDLVAQIREDAILTPVLGESVPLIEGDLA